MSRPTRALARSCRGARRIARETSSRGASSSTKRSPSRRAAGALAADRLGHQEALAPATPITAVGWNCISSRSASCAPAAWASSRPIPIEPGGLVVRDHSAAAPPVPDHDGTTHAPAAPSSQLDARTASVHRRTGARWRARLEDRDPRLGGRRAPRAGGRSRRPGGGCRRRARCAAPSGRLRGRARGGRGGRRRSARRARSRSATARGRLGAEDARRRLAHRARAPAICVSREVGLRGCPRRPARPRGRPAPSSSRSAASGVAAMQRDRRTAQSGGATSDGVEPGGARADDGQVGLDGGAAGHAGCTVPRCPRRSI
jgi:hypothetical protein